MKILEIKVEFIDRNLERELANLALLALREKDFYFRFRAMLEDSGENIRKKGY